MHNGWLKTKWKDKLVTRPLSLSFTLFLCPTTPLLVRPHLSCPVLLEWDPGRATSLSCLLWQNSVRLLPDFPSYPLAGWGNCQRWLAAMQPRHSGEGQGRPWGSLNADLWAVCLAESAGLASPPGRGYRLAHGCKVHTQDRAMLAFQWLKGNFFQQKESSLSLVKLRERWWVSSKLGTTDLQGTHTGEIHDAGLTWIGWIPLNNGPLLADHPQNHATLGQY